MELREIRQTMTASASVARMWAERMDWTVRKFEKAGLVKIELVRGHAEVDALVEQGHVILSRLGATCLIGYLK